MKTLKIPFSIDLRGGLSVTESTNDIIEQQITDLLVTAHFERVMNPAYGLGVPEFVFSPIRNSILSQRAEEIRAALQGAITLADIVTVTLAPTIDNNSTLYLDVRYRVRPSPQVFSLQKTVTGLVTDETFGATL